MSDRALSDQALIEQVGASYDPAGLRALQNELRRLNAAAHADRLFDDGTSVKRAVPDDAAPKPPKGARKRGKAAARRLLDLAGRHEDDDSPDVPGTRFTEAGVVRLLARLRRRRESDGAWPRFLDRVQRALGRPVPNGEHLVAGVGLARLQVACRQILEIEAHGLAHLAARRAIRRGRIMQTSALTLGVAAGGSKAASTEAPPSNPPPKPKPPKQGGSN